MQKHIFRQKPIDKIEITLKSIRTLTFACSDAKLLVDLNEKLQHAMDELQSQLPHAEGILLRPALISQALSTKGYTTCAHNSKHCSIVTDKKLTPNIETDMVAELIA